MLAEIARRLGTLLLAGLLGAALVRLAPGFGIDEQELDPRLSVASVEQLRQEAGRGADVTSYYWQYLKRLGSGDLGRSRLFDQPVRSLFVERLPLTARVVGWGWVLGFLAAVLSVCLVSAMRGRGEAALSSFGSALVCVPSGLAAIALYLAGLPVAIGVAAAVFPKVFFQTQAVFREGLGNQYVLAAYAQGSGFLRVLAIQVLTPAARTIFSISGVALTAALGADIPLEAVTDTPGLGQLAWRAAQGRDLELLTALTLMAATIAVVASAIGDYSSNRLEGSGR